MAKNREGDIKIPDQGIRGVRPPPESPNAAPHSIPLTMPEPVPQNSTSGHTGHSGGTAFTVFDYLGLGFILEPPAVWVNAAMTGAEPIKLVNALYGIPFVLIGAICIYVGRNWDRFKTKWNKVFVDIVERSSRSYVALSVIFIVFLAGIAVLPILIWPPAVPEKPIQAAQQPAPASEAARNKIEVPAPITTPPPPPSPPLTPYEAEKKLRVIDEFIQILSVEMEPIIKDGPQFTNAWNAFKDPKNNPSFLPELDSYRSRLQGTFKRWIDLREKHPEYQDILISMDKIRYPTDFLDDMEKYRQIVGLIITYMSRDVDNSAFEIITKPYSNAVRRRH
jgi:hypothetical protein